MWEDHEYPPAASGEELEEQFNEQDEDDLPLTLKQWNDAGRRETEAELAQQDGENVAQEEKELGQFDLEQIEKDCGS